MFTGIVTDVGRLRSLERRGDLRLVIETVYDLSTVETGASIACNGICLTVVDKGSLDKGRGWFAADASAETERVTTLGNWREGTPVNLERSLKVGDELGGHIVTGHVDCMGDIVAWDDVGDSVTMSVRVPSSHGRLLAQKGSVAVDGVSLTVNSVRDNTDGTVFTVNLIPHTRTVTGFAESDAGARVNIEFDVMARYVARLAQRS